METVHFRPSHRRCYSDVRRGSAITLEALATNRPQASSSCRRFFNAFTPIGLLCFVIPSSIDHRGREKFVGKHAYFR
jgi:hypothetical protein